MPTTTNRVSSPATGEVAYDDEVDAYLGDGSTMQKLREQADAVVERFRPQIATAEEFARNDPMKAVLVSAAAGAALMALVGLMVRSSSRSTVERALNVDLPRRPRHLNYASIRDAAIDLADRAQHAANQALSAGKSAYAAGKDAYGKGKDTYDSAREEAASRAESTSERLADTWATLRDQAEPLIDRIKPQIDAAVDYAKNEPGRAALGLAAAGAVLVGLLSLINSAESD